MLRLTGRYGDGWYPTAVASPGEYAAGLAAVRAAAQEAGRDPRAITPALLQFILVAPTEQRARAMLDARLTRFATLISAPASVWQKAGAEHPFGPRFRGYIDFVPERYDRATLERAIAAVPPALVGHGLIWGTPEQIADKLREFGAAGLRHVVLSVGSSAFSPGMALYGLLATRKIARLLRQLG
jgi:phthiodiolone/phenolphthiodiolone dimycocerosates ketoreductase